MRYCVSVLMGFLMLSLAACGHEADVSNVPNNLTKAIKLPSGFKVNVFADLSAKGILGTLHHPRLMTFDAAGNLYVSMPVENKIVMFEPNKQQPKQVGRAILVAKDLNAPHGLTFVGEKLYVANQDGIVVLEKNDGRWPSKPPVKLVEGLPTDGHNYKSLKLGPDGYLYLNVGSSCNVCKEKNPLHATILRYTTDGKPAGAVQANGEGNSPIYATGLRNSQGFVWHPQTQAMFATNEGADNRTFTRHGLADEWVPPEHLNQIMPGLNYGWPHCWGNLVTDRVDPEDQKSNPHRWGQLFEDPNFKGDEGFCEKATPPAMVFESHSTPIGIAFLHQSHFPKAYQTDAIVALHGSWNRTHPSGYQLVRVKFKGDKPVGVEDFATGWLADKAAFGRPVDVQVAPDGVLLVTDDRAGLIYRIAYE